MSLPININELITGQTVEWERIEFKKGWNPLDVLRTISAFANDLNNWGGGYIVIGIEERDGKPVLPPVGLKTNQIDKMQKELLHFCHKMIPPYFPIAEPVEFQGKLIFVIWVPGGSFRPYKLPDAYYIRRFSVTKKASPEEERELLQMSAQIPFDDQILQTASIDDLKLQLIHAFLHEIGSTLADQSDLSFVELCRKMNIVEGPDEYLRPKNIGLLMFNETPEKFFSGTRIELVEFQNEEGDTLTEKIFTGPLPNQIRSSLAYMKNSVVAERVQKIPNQAEAKRFFNYPFVAIEEALVNAVYHRSYQDDSPIEVRVFPNKIELLSFPGPMPPLDKKKLDGGTIASRKYRNRRIGDFLKELHLTEGRGTGIPKIQHAMKHNGSPEPIFDTDDNLAYFLTILPIHASWPLTTSNQDRIYDGIQDGTYDRGQRDKILLEYCVKPHTRRELLARLGLFNSAKNFSRNVKHLLDEGYVERTLPTRLRSKNQQYRTTQKGQEFLKR